VYFPERRGRPAVSLFKLSFARCSWSRWDSRNLSIFASLATRGKIPAGCSGWTGSRPSTRRFSFSSHRAVLFLIQKRFLFALGSFDGGFFLHSLPFLHSDTALLDASLACAWTADYGLRTADKPVPSRASSSSSLETCRSSPQFFLYDYG
jgi:hypothetical protein